MTKKIGTHSGSFHADEAMACFLLRNTKEFKDAEIVRSRDPAVLEKLDIIVDVGGEYVVERKRFDHHQRGFFETFSGKHEMKLSSAGLIYKHYGQEVISNLTGISIEDPLIPFFHNRIYKNFIEALDGIDNGVTQYESDKPPKYKNGTDLSSRVGRLNPAWNETDVDVQARFEKAVAMTGAEFTDSVNFLWRSWYPARSIVEKSFEARFEVDPSGLIVVLEQGCPWMEHFFDIEEEKQVPEEKKPLYMLFSESTGASTAWRIRAIPPFASSFDNRLALPKEWRGLRDEELSKATGIEGCVFIHISGFIGGTQTKEGVIQMARKALQIGGRA